MFDAIAKEWMPVYGPNSATAPTDFRTDSGGADPEPNYGGLGYGGNDPFSASNNDFLKNLGWTGGNPYVAAPASGGNENGAGQNTDGYSPEFQQFLRDRGLTFRQRPDGSSNMAFGAFDANGNQVGSEYTRRLDTQDPGPMLAMMAGLGGVLGPALIGGAGAAGAGGSGLSADALAYGALENGAAYGGGYGGTMLAGEMVPGALGAEAAAGGSADLAAMFGAGGYGAAASPAELAAGAGGGGGFLSSLGDLAGDAGSWMTKNPGLVNTGGSALNALIGAYTGNKALNRQTDATNQANALWEPYRQFGTQNLGRANGLLANPSSIAQDPGYQFTTQQGMQALDRSAASKGNLYSGAQMKGAQRFGQDNANTYFDKILGRYTGAAQLGATGTTNISNNLTNLGQAGAGAAMYQGNVAQNAVNNALGNYNWSQYANDLRKGPN